MRRVAEVFYLPHIPTQLVCAACGAVAHASCECGADYVSKGARAQTAIKENPHRTNIAIATQLGIDEATVRRARKRLHSAHAEPSTRAITSSDGVVRVATRLGKRSAPPPIAKAFKPRKLKGHKKPVTEKDQLIAFTRELAQFVMDYSIELTKWLDANPKMEAKGRDALGHTLEAYSMQLQRLAQRVEGR